MFSFEQFSCVATAHYMCVPCKTILHVWCEDEEGGKRILFERLKVRGAKGCAACQLRLTKGSIIDSVNIEREEQ